MSDLLPCPFCGSAVKVGELTDIDYIYCDSCGVSGPVCEGKESAIEAWNRRAPDPRDAQEERAYSMLAAEGVSRERARSVANGIAVLAQRWRKQAAADAAQVAALTADRDAWKAAAEKWGVATAEYGAEREAAADEATALQDQLAEQSATIERYRDALVWIARVNAMDYEYQAKARAALRGTGDGWVPVTERLPDGPSPVLTVRVEKIHGMVMHPIGVCAYFDHDKDNYAWAKGWHVTHWRPLPPPPAGKEAQP